MFVRNGTARLKRVLLSKPEYLKPAPINEIAKKWKSSVLDSEKMLREHEALVNAYKQAGVEIEFLEADPKRPNSVFARDFGGCVKEGYILGRFKLPIRELEQIDYKNKMKMLEIPMIAQVKEGCFEGGDFAFLNEKTIAIGMADRSNERGVEEIQKQLLPYGYDVIPVPLKSEYLHLDMCFNLVDDHLAVAYKEGLPEYFQKYLRKMDIKLVCVPEETIFYHSCNLQSLGCHRVLSLKHNEVVNEALSKEGMEVIPLDITEILKAGGGPHCMTFPLWRE
ncbi:dimethylarginine dimethylaminohydrolase family protein [Anaerosacchariphilus polymeriproducens]|uniref:Nitrate reductase n=1 Tax=Anaerosacchariphilus polymeriproducens TaxID=1812858 RepID=A0A371AZR6_9FIRM|nr:arginine deiminase family protein [Anaerosacchariphilus polymeriproducens]RDU25057.1 nitrate reductase [Anaerosacchariphilus polymeriproducens]